MTYVISGILLTLTMVLVGLGAVMLSVLTLVRGLRIPSGRRGGPTCGRCGYGVSLAMPQDRCPECGVSMEVVGIPTPLLMARARVGPVQLYTSWGVLAGFFGLMIGYMIFFVTAFATAGSFGTVRSMSTVRLTPSRFEGTPTYALRVDADLIEDGSWGEPTADTTNEPGKMPTTVVPSGLDGTITIELLRPGDPLAGGESGEEMVAAGSLAIELAMMNWTLRDAGGAVVDGGTGVGLEALGGLYERAGLAFDDEERVDAGHLIAMVNQGLEFGAWGFDSELESTLVDFEGADSLRFVADVERSATPTFPNSPTGPGSWPDLFSSAEFWAFSGGVVVWGVITVGGFVLIAVRRAGLLRAA